MVVLGVGTTGIAGKCGPSNIMQANAGLLYGDLIKQLIDSGTAVVVPDYEGRGPAQVPGLPDAHPYLHVGSAGNSMVLAAVASKRLLGNALSGAWAAWGHSQGGHAALAAAQFASLGERLEPALDYRGAVAVARLVGGRCCGAACGARALCAAVLRRRLYAARHVFRAVCLPFVAAGAAHRGRRRARGGDV